MDYCSWMGRERGEKTPSLPCSYCVCVSLILIRVTTRNWLFIVVSLPLAFCLLVIFLEVALRVVTYFNTNRRRDDIMTFPCNKLCSPARG